MGVSSAVCRLSSVFWLSKRLPNGHTGGVFAILNNLTLTARMAGHTLAYFGSRRWRQTSPLPCKATQVPTDFLGLCVANAPDSACDDYVIARLNELGIRHVRLDFTYGDRDAFTERFLDRLLADRFRVCLHLVQPREEARAMLRMSGAAERWRAFISDMLDRYGSRMELIEIGATCNRRKWAGYSPAAFLVAWKIAWEEARGRNLAIAGPNVTDFEPAYNAGWLGEFRRAGMLPSVHTDNLFVERATEPEAYDHKIAGQRLASLLRFNLVRKAQLLQDIGAWAGVPTLMCTHVAWSLRRIARFLEDGEEKQADYLGRYACLAAASGALARVYWGPLIGQREGLIDDGTSEYPELPHVTYYEQARGEIKDYRLRPAFKTFQTVNRLLAGATFQRRLATGTGLEILEFKHGGRRTDNGSVEEKQTSNPSADGPHAQSLTKNEERRTRNGAILHAVWTTDGNGASAEACYPPELLAQAEIYARDGQRLERAPRMFSESPVFLVWQDQRPEIRGQPALRSLGKAGKSEVSQTKKEDRRPKTEGSIIHDQTSNSSLQPSAFSLQPSCLQGYRFARKPGWDFDVLRPEANAMGLGGVYLAEDGTERVDIQALLNSLRESNAEIRSQRSAVSDPAKRGASQQSTILRAARNTVWSVSAPWNAEKTIVIKVFKPRNILRRFLDYGKPNKAVRSWNGAQELLRRGLHTPTPLACLIPEKTALDIASIRPSATIEPLPRERSIPSRPLGESGGSGAGKHERFPLTLPSPEGEGINFEIPMHRDCTTSYYICEAFAPTWSARDAFTAFSSGATEFQGYSTNAWYGVIAVFLQKLHTRGVYFRDLSAGNLLVRATPSGKLEFALIDTARARFYPRSLGLRLRLCDLMRICHPLDWPNRRVFVEKYLAHSGRRFRWWMKIPFCYYDWKHRVKNRWKRK